MRFVLYVSKAPRSLLQLFVERVFVNANGLVSDAPEGRIAYKTRFVGFMRWRCKHLALQITMRARRAFTTQPKRLLSETDITNAELAKRRHDAVRAQMLYGGMR